ncbi:MAG: hypothetical protein ACRBG0_15205 [Lewinella sp.]|uniref:hypothetical protein n=1 Tax=Lewinella sp. TaxID=2004506 RepID=UPI003D6A93EA
MSDQKNIVKYNTIRVTGDMQVGDIYNFINKEAENAFVIIIVAMTQDDFSTLLDEKMTSFKIEERRVLYQKDECDDDEDLKDFYNSCFKDVVSKDYYHDTTLEWKPFRGKKPSALNINEILTNIFSKRTTKVRCLYLESDLPLSKLIKDDHDIETFIDISEKAVLIFDPISLSHQVHREFIEEIGNIPIGGVISPTCSYLPKNIQHFSKLFSKRIVYKWHIDAKKPDAPFYFQVPDKDNFQKNILTLCMQLGHNIQVDIFKGSKNITNNTRHLG